MLDIAKFLQSSKKFLHFLITPRNPRTTLPHAGIRIFLRKNNKKMRHFPKEDF